MNIVLVHGFHGHPNNFWFPWLRRELEARGHQVTAPIFPHPLFPKREEWQRVVEGTLSDPAHTMFVGHSLGCAAILHALREYQGPIIPGVILVAGFGRDFLGMMRWMSWFDVSLDFSMIRHTAKSWTCIHSVNDPLVPFTEGEWLAEQLGAQLIVDHQGHFNQRGHNIQLPVVLEAIIKHTSAF